MERERERERELLERERLRERVVERDFIGERERRWMGGLRR